MEDTLDLERVRGKLQDEATRLQGRISAKTGSHDEGRNPDRSDLAQAYTSRERNSALLAIEEQRLQQIQSALQRLDDGSYGNCTSCGQAISPDRLEIIPYATLCVSCQANQE